METAIKISFAVCFSFLFILFLAQILLGKLSVKLAVLKESWHILVTNHYSFP